MGEIQRHKGMTLSLLLEEAALECPQKKAVFCGGASLTYGELNARAAGLALGFQKLGVEAGNRVGIFMGNCLQYLESLFALAKLGAVAVPINTFLTGHELVYILKDSEAKVLVVSNELLERVEGMLDGAETLSHVVRVGDGLPGPIDFEGIVEQAPADSRGRSVDVHDLAFIVYTSGTTGYPKGAMLTHWNVVTNLHAGTGAIPLGVEDRMLVFLPMFHVYTLTACLMAPIHSRAAIVLVPSIRPFSRLLKEIVLKRPTLFMGIPPVYEILVEKRFPGLTLMLNSIRLYFSAAAPLSEETIVRFQKKFGRPLLQGYGLSEASPAICMNRLDEAQRPGSVGRPLEDIEVKLVDEEGRDVSTGEVGELIAKGPNIMKGYLHLPEETAQTLRDGWLYTGDMARADEDGYLYIVDRKKDMIIVHGMNVYPREVELVLAQHPKVKASAVIGKSDGLGERVVAVVQTVDGVDVSSQELKDFCKERLAPFKVPHMILFRDSLPMTPTMKIKKKELREELAAEWEGKPPLQNCAQG